MITQASTSLDLLTAAAGAAAVTLGGSAPLTVGTAGRDADDAAFGTSAVLASFSGPMSGDILIVASDELSNALAEADGSYLDLAAALTPAMNAIATAIGPVVLGPVQSVDARLGVGRIMAAADAAVVPLLSGGEPRVAIALSVTAPASGSAPASSGDLQHERLELLRGVAMEATVELGRARMTVNELLALRPGTVVELDQAAGTPADLMVNGRLIARGEVVVVDENYGLRITNVVTDAAER